MTPRYLNPCEIFDLTSLGVQILAAASYIALSELQSIVTLAARPHCQREGCAWKRAASVHHSHAADLSGHEGFRSARDVQLWN